MHMFLLIVFLAFASVPRAMAENVIILTGEWAPYVSESLPQYGYTAEIVTHALLASDIEPVYKFMPWKRCAKMVESGEAFAAFPYAVTEERKKYSYFSEPIAQSRNVFFYLKSKLGSFDYNHLDELKSKTIGGVAGYFYKKIFQEAGLKMDYASGEESAFKKLYMGRVDLVPASELVGWQLINKLYPGESHKFGSTATAFKANDLHLMVSKSFPEATALLQRFNDGLQVIKDKGIDKQLRGKYNFSQ